METKRMTKKAQRIAIAQDVLKQLDAGEVIPGHLYYYRKWNHIDKVYEGPCHTCALGACWVGMVHLKSLPLPAPGTGPTTIQEELTEIFSRKQLVLIECAFEGYQRAMGLVYRGSQDTPAEAQVKRAAEFYDRYKDDGERMRTIMENIIRNGGQFKI